MSDPDRVREESLLAHPPSLVVPIEPLAGHVRTHRLRNHTAASPGEYDELVAIESEEFDGITLRPPG